MREETAKRPSQESGISSTLPSPCQPHVKPSQDPTWKVAHSFGSLCLDHHHIADTFVFGLLFRETWPSTNEPNLAAADAQSERGPAFASRRTWSHERQKWSCQGRPRTCQNRSDMRVPLVFDSWLQLSQWQCFAWLGGKKGAM